jgi:hypothetical protein
MLAIISCILYLVAFVCFVCAAARVPSPPRWDLLAAGLAAWVLPALIAALKGLG